MIGIGLSPLRPKRTCSRSDCSVFVGRPVLGPPRWMLAMTSGSSRTIARFIASLFRQMPGPLVAGDRESAAKGGADRGADGGDLILGLEGAHVEVLQRRQLVQDVAGRA